jgi:hypothetical protein
MGVIFSPVPFRLPVGQLVEPFQNLDHVITEKSLHIPQLLKLYETYLYGIELKSFTHQAAGYGKQLRLSDELRDRPIFPLLLGR